MSDDIKAINAEILQTWAEALYKSIGTAKVKAKNPDGSWMTHKDRENKKADIIKMIAYEGSELHKVLKFNEGWLE